MIVTQGFKDSLTLEVQCPVCGAVREDLLANMSVYAADNGIPLVVLPQCIGGGCATRTHVVAQPLNEETESRFLEFHMNRCLFSRLHTAGKYDTDNEALVATLDAFKTTQEAAYNARGDATRKAEFDATQIPTDKAT